jgi:hypothetical protein
VAGGWVVINEFRLSWLNIGGLVHVEPIPQAFQLQRDHLPFWRNIWAWKSRIFDERGSRSEVEFVGKNHIVILEAVIPWESS